MKTRNVVVSVLSVSVISVVATLLFSGVGLSLKTRTHPKPPQRVIDVEFNVDTVSDKLEITQPICTGGKPNGCISVVQGHTGSIKFRFSTGTPWKLTEFQICKGKVKKDLVKTGLVCGLSVWERLDFFISSDDSGTEILVADSTGSFDLTQLPSGSTEFYLFSQNSIRKHYFYSIKACKASPPGPDTCVSTDPPIINKGRN